MIRDVATARWLADRYTAIADAFMADVTQFRAWGDEAQAQQAAKNAKTFYELALCIQRDAD